MIAPLFLKIEYMFKNIKIKKKVNTFFIEDNLWKILEVSFNSKIDWQKLIQELVDNWTQAIWRKKDWTFVIKFILIDIVKQKEIFFKIFQNYKFTLILWKQN